jgi:CYTH domain-containing protein
MRGVDALADTLEARGASEGGLPREIERKYLLDGLPPEGRDPAPVEIDQGYLPGQKLIERVRRTRDADGERYFRTIKLGKGLSRIEVEEETDRALFTKLWSLTKGRRVRKRRHRIEHIEMIDPADINRLKQLGVVASLQPIAGVGVPGSPPEPILSRVGNKLPWSYAWQTLRDAGAVIAFSSDWPVAPLSPFLGMQAAMTAVPLRPDCPPQAQSLMDTLNGFTAAGAYTEFMEHAKGTLKEGYLADVVVLDADMETTPKDQVANVRPMTTICDGRMSFEA